MQRAGARGHLDVLKWLRERGCPWDEETCYEANMRGHFDVYDWALENGCPTKESDESDESEGW